MKILNSNIFKYTCVGGVCTVFDLSAFLIFAKLLGFNYIFVSSVGFAIATLLNYYLCIRFIFLSGTRFNKKKELATIYFVSFIGLLFNQLTLLCFVEVLGIEILLSKIGATAVVFLWNYFVRSFYVFSKSS